MRIAGVPNSQAAVIMFLTTLSLQQLTHDHACIHACGLPKTADRKTKQNNPPPKKITIAECLPSPWNPVVEARKGMLLL